MRNTWQVVLRLALLLCLLCWSVFSQAADEFKVVLILSDDNPVYQRFADSYRDSLPMPHKLTLIKGANKFVGAELQADLIVTVGSKAASAVIDRTALPILLTMLPSHLYRALQERRPPSSQLSALFVDQPWTRHIELLFAALPGTHRIGVLYTPAANLDLDELRKLAARHEAKLIARPVNDPEQLFGALEDTLNHSEVLLAVPDSDLYNSNNIRNILMTSYRHDIPLIGLSQSYVNAGALCAVYSTPEELGMQAGTMSHSYALSRRLPAAQFPLLYDVATNTEVARTLGIQLKTAEQLRTLLQRAEAR